MRKSHRQHRGERDVQARRGVPAEVSQTITGAIADEMSPGHAAYYGGLGYLSIGALDGRGRPWVTLLCNPETTARSPQSLAITARVTEHDPFVRAALSPGSGTRQFAGVGIDFPTRSRVKLAGEVASARMAGERLELELLTNEHMGNCPKYITARQLIPVRRTPDITSLGDRLSSAARAVVEQASTVFIATRHLDPDVRESDMGVNHRGGPSGFVRYVEDEHGAHLVLPDYSGNRFYQSLGNVQTDPVLGMAVPDFATGALVQITGHARNLFDDDASRVLPGTSLITVITIEEAYLTTGALDLQLVGDEQPSPYNPKLRYLAVESGDEATTPVVKARLEAVTRRSARVSTFTFALPDATAVIPGQHAILDFSGLVRRGYRHMNDQDPQSLNDDYVRSYTVSGIGEGGRRLAVTVKRSGVVSSYLHSLDRPGALPVEVTFKGIEGTFTCFDDDGVPERMLWVAGGSGITPFLAMHQALQATGRPMPEIDLFYACRGDEAALAENLGGIRVHLFRSRAGAAGPAGAYRAHARRLQADDFDTLPLLDRRIPFLCGPARFMADVRSWLEARVDPMTIRSESFDF